MRFESIVVDVDATAAVHPELERAAILARRCGARLTIVDSMAARDARPLPAGIDEAVVAGRRQDLLRLAHRVPELPTTARLLVGPSATVLIEEVVRSKHDLLVRSHARDVTAASDEDGGVGEELVRKCPCPVLLVGHGRMPEQPRIVGVVTLGKDDAATDPSGARVVEVMLAMARLEHGAPMLLQTWEPFAEQMIRAHSPADAFATYVETARRRVAGNLAALTRSFGAGVSDIRTIARRGRPEDIIPEFAVREGIDLVVMAKPACHAGIAGFFFVGTTLKLLKKLTCSLLAVRVPAN
jgi:nucleotide-binding universal stress UspA family protein